MYRCIDCKYNVNDVCGELGISDLSYRDTRECTFYKRELTPSTISNLKDIDIESIFESAYYGSTEVEVSLNKNKNTLFSLERTYDGEDTLDKIKISIGDESSLVPVAILKHFLNSNMKSISTLIED